MWLGVNRPVSPNPLVLNLDVVANYDSSQPFLNIVKGSSSNFGQTCWSTRAANGSTDTNEEQYLSAILDSNGYPTSLTCPGIPGGQQFTTLDARVNIALVTAPGASGPYPSGAYRFQFIGQGTILFFLDAASLSNPTGGATINGMSVTNASASTYVTVTVNVTTPSGSGIGWRITAINSGTDYPRDMSLVQSVYTSSYDQGQIFHPTFISALEATQATVLRFMQPLQTNTMVSGYFSVTQNLFTSNPATNDTTATLVTAWPGFSGIWLITLPNGQDFQATFSAGNTAVILNGTVISNCPNAGFHLHAYVGWSNRQTLSQVSYTRREGIPYEICILLANAVGMDPWINVPFSFGSSDWASLCSLVLSTIASGHKCYVEISNEVWNGAFQAEHYTVDKSPTVFSGSDGGSFYGRQVALVADQFASTAGVPAFDNTFIFVMGGQAASTTFIIDALTTPSWVGNTSPWKRVSASGQKTIKRAAIAPYFGLGAIPSADFTHLTGLADGGYTDFFASWQQNPVNGYTFTRDGTNALPPGGWFGLETSWISTNYTAMQVYGGLPLICYEGGWQFTAGTGQQTFLINASRDARITALYKAYLHGCVTSGAPTPAQYTFCGTYGGSQWGLLESVMQPVSPLSSAPNKFQGAVGF